MAKLLSFDKLHKLYQKVKRIYEATRNPNCWPSKNYVGMLLKWTNYCHKMFMMNAYVTIT